MRASSSSAASTGSMSRPSSSSARQHQPRLQLEQRGDQDEELGGRLEVELTGPLEVLDVREHDLREVDLEQVDLLLQHERQEQVERPVEDLEVEVERGDGHRRRD